MSCQRVQSSSSQHSRKVRHTMDIRQISSTSRFLATAEKGGECDPNRNEPKKKKNWVCCLLIHRLHRVGGVVYHSLPPSSEHSSALTGQAGRRERATHPFWCSAEMIFHVIPLHLRGRPAHTRIGPTHPKIRTWSSGGRESSGHSVSSILGVWETGNG